jgi:hypothetical protein
MFQALRVAGYHAATGLALHAWGAEELCGHPSLLARLLDTGSEADVVARDFRHNVIVHLAKTAAAAEGGAAAAAAAERLAIAARHGPYGAPGRRVEPAPQVATMQM